MAGLKIDRIVNISLPEAGESRISQVVRAENLSLDQFAVYKVRVNQAARYRVKPSVGVVSPGEHVDINLSVREKLPEPLEEIEDYCLVTVFHEDLAPPGDIAILWKNLPPETSSRISNVYFSVKYFREVAEDAAAAPQGGVHATDDGTVPAAPTGTAELASSSLPHSSAEPTGAPVSSTKLDLVQPTVPSLDNAAPPRGLGSANGGAPSSQSKGVTIEDPKMATTNKVTFEPLPDLNELRATLTEKENELSSLNEEWESILETKKPPSIVEQVTSFSKPKSPQVKTSSKERTPLA
uniref:MSP domain-containing protein n=1 Tax=Rhodosorus marinus TaxID=101924 RepID=A0A7S0BE97_9RHOD|mmetsp:Transcript_12523/g.18156  ORF Transcript_12523/g.18156 Transcript_12523/m.18156 type:complete len:295 (+) Transcript_12523:45-929(+)